MKVCGIIIWLRLVASLVKLKLWRGSIDNCLFLQHLEILGMVFFVSILLLLLHRRWFSNYFVCSPPGKWSFFGFYEHIFETGGEKPPPAVYPIHAISPCIHPVGNLSSSLKLRSCPNTSGSLSSLDLRNLSWVFYPLNPFDVVWGDELYPGKSCPAGSRWLRFF